MGKIRRIEVLSCVLGCILGLGAKVEGSKHQFNRVNVFLGVFIVEGSILILLKV